MKTINITRDPYGRGFTPTRPRQIEIEEGITVLVGCNGAGKTTLLETIQSQVKAENIPCMFYSDLKEESLSKSYATFSGDMELFSELMSSSEGEAICVRFAEQLKKVMGFLDTGEVRTPYSDLFKALSGEEGEKKRETRERWILLDSLDSGASIDNIVNLKDVLKTIIEVAKTKNLSIYIVISANEYELATDNTCMDVTNGKKYHFQSYDEYKKVILETSKKLANRYKRIAERNQ